MKLFLLGVNGISMHGIAKIMQEQGHQALGFDDSMKKLSTIKYSQEIPEETDLVIYSSAIKESHPLLKQAKEKKIQIIQRTDFFVQYMPFNKNIILVAGAHGKTTTSSMITYMLGCKSYYLGGIINGEESSAKFTQNSKYTVVETDESDGSFLKWQGNYKILLNFDYEHMIFYKNKENIKKYYYDFVMNNIENTKVIIFQEAKDILKIPNHQNIITYGKKDANYVCKNIITNKDGISFDINNQKIKLPILGIHNAYNFTAIYALFKLLNLSIDNIKNFKGVKKRMQKIYYKDHKLDFFLDYGHHPNEIKSVLESLKKHYPNKTFDIIFEGHKPSRILDNLDVWPNLFNGYNVWLYPIFIADEKEINENEFHFSDKKFLDILLKNNVNARILKVDLSNLPINVNNLICFSAGHLSEILSKY